MADAHEAQYGLKRYAELRDAGASGRDRLARASDPYASVRPYTSAPYTQLALRAEQERTQLAQQVEGKRSRPPAAPGGSAKTGHLRVNPLTSKVGYTSWPLSFGLKRATQSVTCIPS